MAAMAAAFPGQIPAVQVGATFAGQYYQLLEQQPGVVHRFYTDISTMMRIQGGTGDTAVGIMQIHSLVMSLGVHGIKIKSANYLDSWAGGVLVTVSGSVQTKDYNARRKFVQTFFLAPQEKGYFVLNDIFQFVDDDKHTLQQPQTISQNHFDSTSPMAEPVPDYMLRGEVQARNFEAPVHAEENEAVDKYSVPEPAEQITECSNRVEETLSEEPVVSSPCMTNTVRDLTPAHTEEPVGGPPKQTYASILRVAKGHLGHSATQSVSLSKPGSIASEWHHTSHSSNQHSHPVVPLGSEKPSLEAVESFAGLEDEGDPRSIYVGNLPSSISASELEQEFKNFGRINYNGVTVRNRKDSSVNYAFVDFEDVVGAQNALKASPILINGYKIYVEERKSSNSTSRMGRRSRGRGDYLEVPRGRMSVRGLTRGSGHENDKEFSPRLRGNGFHSRSPHQERGLLGNHNSRNVYPRIKVREEEEEDSITIKEEASSRFLLRLIESLSLDDHYSSRFPASSRVLQLSQVPRSQTKTCSPLPPCAKISKSNHPSFSTPPISTFKGKANREFAEINKTNTRASSVPRPRAVLSSPDNDKMIGNHNKEIRSRGGLEKRRPNADQVLRKHASPHELEKASKEVGSTSRLKEKRASQPAASRPRASIRK